MIKENYKNFQWLWKLRRKFWGVWFGVFFFPLSFCFQKTIALLEDTVYPGKEVGPVELSRGIVSCTINVFCEGYCCEHPFCPVWKYLNRKNRKILPNCAACWKQALQDPFHLEGYWPMCGLRTRNSEFRGIWREMESIRNLISSDVFDFLGERGKEPSSVSVLKLLNLILKEHKKRTGCSSSESCVLSFMNLQRCFYTSFYIRHDLQYFKISVSKFSMTGIPSFLTFIWCHISLSAE